MDRNLFLAILSMDSYNRGYGRQIKFNFSESTSPRNEVGAMLGNAIVNAQSDITEGTPGVTAGFYAIAYNVSGVSGFTVDTKVVMYRGSDNIPSAKGIIRDFLLSPFGYQTTSDAQNGFGVALGSPYGPQATLALQFYRAVTDGDPNGLQ